MRIKERSTKKKNLLIELGMFGNQFRILRKDGHRVWIENACMTKNRYQLARRLG